MVYMPALLCDMMSTIALQVILKPMVFLGHTIVISSRWWRKKCFFCIVPTGASCCQMPITDKLIAISADNFDGVTVTANWFSATARTRWCGAASTFLSLLPSLNAALQSSSNRIEEIERERCDPFSSCCRCFPFLLVVVVCFVCAEACLWVLH